MLLSLIYKIKTHLFYYGRLNVPIFAQAKLNIPIN